MAPFNTADQRSMTELAEEPRDLVALIPGRRCHAFKIRKTRALPPSSYRVPQNGPQTLGRDAARVRKVDFMVPIAV